MVLQTIVDSKPKIQDQKIMLLTPKWEPKLNLLRSCQLLLEKVVTFLLQDLRRMTTYVRNKSKRREEERINIIDKLMLRMTKRLTR
jgi:hypothetical protein